MRLSKLVAQDPDRRSSLRVLAIVTVGLVVMWSLHSSGSRALSAIELGLWEIHDNNMKSNKDPNNATNLTMAPPPLEDYPYCDQNSKSLQCCSADQCALVVQSTLFSDCCDNTVTQENTTRTVLQRIPNKLLPILITATPRSGTAFTQTLLRNLGVSVTDDQKTPNFGVGMISWMHIYQDTQYFGTAVVGGSKFKAVWHQVRDPLKSLTSLSFTEPLKDDLDSVNYLQFLGKHIQVTNKTEIIKSVMLQDSSLEQQGNATLKSARLQEDILIWRGLEFYLQWNQFILSLKVPRFQLEDIVVQQNMTVLDNIFKSMGQPPPKHDNALGLIERIQRSRQRRRLIAVQEQDHTNSREHRPTLEWGELCRVDPDKAQQFLKLSHEFRYYLEREKACLSAV